jgi:hypothetical protein
MRLRQLAIKLGQALPHDATDRRGLRDHAEASSRKRSFCARIQREGAGFFLWRDACVSFYHGRTETGGESAGCLDQLSGEALTTMVSGHVKARNGPDRRIIDWLQIP